MEIPLRSTSADYVASLGHLRRTHPRLDSETLIPRSACYFSLHHVRQLSLSSTLSAARLIG